MKRSRIIAAVICTAFPFLSASAQENPAGTISYSLPQTAISLDVEAVKEQFYAGPYARFAQKYLGIDAEQEDRTSYQLSSVRLTPCVEADPEARHIVTLPKGNAGETFLKMTAQGLVSVADGSFGKESVWRFPPMGDGDFSDKGLSSNLTTESSTLFRNSNSEDEYKKITVSQNIVVAKSLEQKAQEAANMILDLRKTRIQIVTGDTDATYSGEAMESAIREIERLEKEYLSLFVGYSEYQTQRVQFDVVPKNDSRNHMYVAFRISDTEGLVSADNLAGKPYYLDIVEEGLASPEGAKKGFVSKYAILYRIPCICNVKLTDGVNLILQTRVPVYQFGATSNYPVK